MEPLLTPTTALLYSLLEPSAFESPSALHNPIASEPDVFGHAFGEHNLLKISTSGNHHDLSRSSRASTWEAAREYISPPGSDDVSSPGARNSFIENDQMSFCLFPLHTSRALETFPTSTDEGGLLATAPNHQAAENTFNDSNLTALTQTRKTPKTRNRKRRPLGPEEKELKHAQFLERNRIAADHCRKRKKAKKAGLEEQCRVLGLRNQLLSDMKEDLMAEIRDLKEKVENRTREDTKAAANDEEENIEEACGAVSDESIGPSDDSELPRSGQSFEFSEKGMEGMDIWK